MILTYVFEWELCQSFCCCDSNWYFQNGNYVRTSATLTSWPPLSKCVSWYWSVGWISNVKWARIFICSEQTRSVGSDKDIGQDRFPRTGDKSPTFLWNNHIEFWLALLARAICSIFESWKPCSVLMGDMRRDLVLTKWNRATHQIYLGESLLLSVEGCFQDGQWKNYQ